MLHTVDPPSRAPPTSSLGRGRNPAGGTTRAGRERAPRTPVRATAVHSPAVYQPGYRTIFGRLRENVRTYIRRQLELPRQEIAEIVRANVGAAKWFGVAAAFALCTLVALVVLLIALLALVLPLWASALVILAVTALAAGLTGYVGYRSLE